MAISDEKAPSLRSSVGKLSTLQERFEASVLGKVMISAIIAVTVVVGVVWNLPDSPIKRSLQPAVKPVAATTGLDHGWAMYAPNPNMRVDTVEVHVTMADGENRVWTMQPGDLGIGWWDRWLTLKYGTVLDPSMRPHLAHWVVREVTEPTERVDGVTMVLRAETVRPPGEQPDEGGGRVIAPKILYQENLVGQQ